MKIPKNVAKWTAIASAVGFISGPLVPSYFLGKREEVLKNSPAYTGAVDIEKQLPQYKKDLLQCVPRNKDSPVLGDSLDKCVELANDHDKWESQLANLKKNPEYITTMQKADTLQLHAEYSTALSLLLVIPLTIGTIAYMRRKQEEFAEKNPEYLKKLKELQKTIKGE